MTATKKNLVEPENLAQENARLRGDLLTMARRISHDLRTPLGGIMSSGEVLKEILAESEPDSVVLVDSLLRSADEISSLIKRASFIAKASVNPSPKTLVEMGEVVSGVLQQLESRILKKSATVTEPKSWPQVNGVAAWLDIIWWNFLANALQHAGIAPKIELGWRKDGGKFYFFICDNGSGVPENERGRLFQKFESLHELDSTRGLGLSVVQRLVELQDGDCGYESQSKGGANFYFTLPEK
jgi:K+-sensing histidine kinase KdpD